MVTGNKFCMLTNYIIKHHEGRNFLPAKPVSHDANAKGAHHAAHTEDGNSNTPDNGAYP